MGWYENVNIICPHCKEKTGNEIYRSSLLESYYFACTKCGIRIYCELKQWVVTSSYIDKSIIGKHPVEISPEENYDKSKNENII